MRTAMLLNPSLEEVKLAAAKMGLPDREAQKFFYHFESNGWRVGNHKMVSLKGALAYWKLIWEERVRPQLARPEEPAKSGVNGRNSYRTIADDATNAINNFHLR